MPIKNKNQLFGSGFGQLAEHVDATGRCFVIEMYTGSYAKGFYC